MNQVVSTIFILQCVHAQALHFSVACPFFGLDSIGHPDKICLIVGKRKLHIGKYSIRKRHEKHWKYIVETTNQLHPNHTEIFWTMYQEYKTRVFYVTAYLHVYTKFYSNFKMKKIPGKIYEVSDIYNNCSNGRNWGKNLRLDSYIQWKSLN